MLLCIKEANKMENEDELEDCPFCPNQGWYADYDRYGEVTQFQCEFCWTNPRSKFNALNKMRSQQEPTEVKGDDFMLEELKKKYPYLTFRMNGGSIEAFTRERNSFFFKEEKDATRALEMMNNYAKELNLFMKKYPNLYPAFNDETLELEYLWVNRNGRDAEAIASIDDIGEYDLEKLNEDVGKMLDEGGFWCRGCGKPKSQSEYAFSYIAERYCKKCKDANPKLYYQAIGLTYD